MVNYLEGDGSKFSTEREQKEKHNLLEKHESGSISHQPYFIDKEVTLTDTLAIHRYIALKWKPELLGINNKQKE